MFSHLAGTWKLESRKAWPENVDHHVPQDFKPYQPDIYIYIYIDIYRKKTIYIYIYIFTLYAFSPKP